MIELSLIDFYLCFLAFLLFLVLVRCSFYEDFLEYHDVRVVLDFI